VCVHECMCACGDNWYACRQPFPSMYFSMLLCLNHATPHYLEKNSCAGMEATSQVDEGKESHFGAEYRTTPLPADKKGPAEGATN